MLLNRPREPYVAFTDFKFKTPSGRIELYKEELVGHGAELPYYHEPVEASPANPLYERFPLTLLFSHSRHRIHSSFANLPKFKQLEPEPMVEINPADAAHERSRTISACASTTSAAAFASRPGSAPISNRGRGHRRRLLGQRFSRRRSLQPHPRVGQPHLGELRILRYPGGDRSGRRPVKINEATSRAGF